MDTEAIERLAIDRALGELNEDAAALLDAYLAEHPEMQPAAQDMADMCARAEAAFAGTMQRPSISEVGSRQAEPRRIHWSRLGRWAAVVIVSIGLGMISGRYLRSDVTPSSVTTSHVAAGDNIEHRRDLLDGGSEGFWQSKALALLQTAPHVTTASRDSQASLWGRYQQLRKERSYE